MALVLWQPPEYYYHYYLKVRVRDTTDTQRPCSPLTPEFGADLSAVNVAVFVLVEMVRYLLQLNLTHG